MRFLRIRPAVWAMISCSFSSFTLNVALWSSSVTTPGNSSISSFAIRLLPHRSSAENGRRGAQNQGRFRGRLLQRYRPWRELNPALLGDRAISLVEGDDLFGGDGDELLRHATRDELVGMVVGEQPAVVTHQLFIADRRLDAEHVVGIALGGDDVAHLDVAELGVGETEALGDLPKELFLLGMQRLVGVGDVEQTVEHVLQQLAVAIEYDNELLGIGLVAGDVPLGEIEDAGGVLHLRVGHLERLLEGEDFVPGDDAVGPGHLGAKRDHADGERYLVLGPIPIGIDDAIPFHAIEQRADPAPDRKFGTGSELIPNRHAELPRATWLG